MSVGIKGPELADGGVRFTLFNGGWSAPVVLGHEAAAAFALSMAKMAEFARELEASRPTEVTEPAPTPLQAVP